jgi:hypothetical protein
MDVEAKEHLLRILRDAKIDNVDHWLEQYELYRTPILEKALSCGRCGDR